MPDSENNILAPKPPWLKDQPEIEALLNKAIDRLNANATGKLGFTLKPATFPQLFKQDEKADSSWSLLKTLFEDELAIFSFHENRKRNHLDAIYTGARIRFIPEAEATIRQWLNRPASESEMGIWKRLVDKNSALFPGNANHLSASKITVKGKTPEEIIHGFTEIGKYTNDSEQAARLTLRNLSARCFWQDSKFLDNREELITLLYPALNIKPRPLIINAWLPEKIQGILFIENQDSYTQAIAGVPDTLHHLALIYAAGFKLSAGRIRSDKGTSFHYHTTSHTRQKNLLTSWWYGHRQPEWPVYFWGDLDFAGMDILKKLKQRFTALQAWQPGYQPMLEFLLSGAGHTPETSAKQEQRDTGDTACVYADRQLLPAIRKTQRFIDQEWIY